MGSAQSFVEYACGQMAGAGVVTFRKMFGEYALYLDGKVVALVCNNTLFVKPTDAGRRFAAGVGEAPAYPGGKPWLVIGEQLEDAEWVAALLGITAAELPEPKPKKPKKPKRPGRG